MVRFAAMTYGKIILIGVFSLTGILLDNFHDPERYNHTTQEKSLTRFDTLDGSVEIFIIDQGERGWLDIESDHPDRTN